jgi:hypothetical protein
MRAAAAAAKPILSPETTSRWAPPESRTARDKAKVMLPESPRTIADSRAARRGASLRRKLASADRRAR